MKTQIWLVTGFTGEYSDRMEWNVCAYTTEKKAADHAAKAGARAAQLLQQYGRYHDIPKGANEFDKQMSLDYTGTHYRHEMVELVDAPAALAAWIKIQQ